MEAQIFSLLAPVAIDKLSFTCQNTFALAITCDTWFYKKKKKKITDGGIQGEKEDIILLYYITLCNIDFKKTNLPDTD